jgi:hypothetical protein
MGQVRRGLKGRGRWLALFTLLLFVAGAVPVLADPPGGEGGSEVVGEGPTTADLEVATEKVEEEEAQRARELESPAAVAEREESEAAYTSLSSVAAVSSLLLSSFGEELQTLKLDPARFLTEGTLKRNLGDQGGAVVASEGETQLLESEIPAEVREEDGQMGKVDLSLNATSEGFEPANPLIPLSIPASPAEGVAIGAHGETTITQEGADPQSTASRFGEMDVIYPEVQTDTDLLVSPLSTGVELSDQLRSPESPETLRFEMDLGVPPLLRTPERCVV